MLPSFAMVCSRRSYAGSCPCPREPGQSLQPPEEMLAEAKCVCRSFDACQHGEHRSMDGEPWDLPICGPQPSATSHPPADCRQGDQQWEPASGSLASEHLSEKPTGSRSRSLQPAHHGFCYTSTDEGGGELDERGNGNGPGAGCCGFCCCRSSSEQERCGSTGGVGRRRPQKVVENGLANAGGWSFGRHCGPRCAALSSDSLPISAESSGNHVRGCHPWLQRRSRLCGRVPSVCKQAAPGAGGLNLPVRDHELLHAWLARQSIGTCGYHGRERMAACT
mmetsp:Transcript_15665/g.37156  ORF Transcript_15665/g.37156 Transcript_15665/m.37156 type:complete len:278 (+) Transcript_15665:16-849(+)